MADLRFTREDVENLVQEAMLAGWRLGINGEPEPRIVIDWTDSKNVEFVEKVQHRDGEDS